MTGSLHVGFTGTQRGMSDVQGERVLELLSKAPPFIGHHGDCVGADYHFDLIARRVSGFRGMVIHPPDKDVKRAFCAATWPNDVLRFPKPYLERNQDIIDESACLIVTPKEPHQVLRSGTWSTYRRAVDARRPVAIVMPNGALVFDDAPWPWPA